MEEINKEEISKNSEIKTDEIREESSQVKKSSNNLDISWPELEEDIIEL